MVDENERPQSEESGSGLSRVSAEGRNQALASPEDVAASQDRFLRLLERRTAIYTMGDSSSVPKHVAIDLLRSICFVLGIDPDDPAVPKELLCADLEAEFRRRLAQIECKVELTDKLWHDACVGIPMIPNIALQDTLASIGEFPKKYDFRSMAHEIPASIDYPLCHPVPESVVGVDYIYEYMRRLLFEGDFLQRFELESVERVLAKTCPDYLGLLINLYEPVATNAIGLAVIGRDSRGLDISDEDRAEIACRLGPLGPSQRSRAMREAALSACDVLGIQDVGATQYLAGLVPELLPRIEVALSRGDLRGVFV